ncbi:coiled-coil domain-containing protein 93 [Lepeophtheirus salmonis]|nr:coiled-coil domain-containing protein 93-like [Lepeophtheirus salmonis]XP_040564925.1 coiled-coil domain-containing protein 93-like [Lepeophtheirus salmonis]
MGMDEDYFLICEEIFSLLISAGYYRAQMKGLSSFDKIVGGMTWCLQMMISGDEEIKEEDILEDLLFSEDVSIGAQVQLTEKVVRVLIRFGCPHEIDPHQLITGEMDFPHILPVVRWLVERGIEARMKMMKMHRQIALRTFYDQYGHLYPPSLLQESKLSSQETYDIEEDREGSSDEEQDKLNPNCEDQIKRISLEIQKLEEKKSNLLIEIEKETSIHSEKSDLLESLRKVEENINSDNPDDNNKVAKLSLMIEKSENLKMKEKEFKKTCQRKLDEIISKNQSLLKEIYELEHSSTSEGTKAANQILNDLQDKLSSISMKLVVVERKIDDVPSKFELSQYHKRFVELEEIFESKEFESRKLNISYSTFKELKVFIKNQIVNLDHISDSTPLPNSLSINDFISQLEKLLEEVQTIKKTINDRMIIETDRKNRASKDLEELIDKYRVYTQLAKDLQKLVEKNED